jgi:hypothetical protein
MFARDVQKYVIKSNQTIFHKALDIDQQKNYTHIAVESISIPKTFYTIPTDATLIVNEDGKETIINILKGNYSVRSLQIILNIEFQNCDYTYVMSHPNASIEVDTAKFTFTVSNNSSQPIFSTSSKFLAQALGFVQNVEYQFESNILVSVNVVNFQSYAELVLKSNIVENKSQILQAVYTSTTPYNSEISWNCTDLETYAVPIKNNKSNVYSFSLLTEDDDVIDLNGSSFSFVIQIFRDVNQKQINEINN